MYILVTNGFGFDIITGLFWRCSDKKNVPAGFSMPSSYILFTDSETVLG